MPPRLVAHEKDVAIIDLGFRGPVVASTPYQPDEASLIVFQRVGGSFNPASLKGFYDGVRRRVGREDSVVFLTSVDIGERLVFEELRDPPGLVVVSLGLSPSTCPGAGVYEPLKHQTINVAVALDVPLQAPGLVDLFRVVVEAKCLAVVELLLRCALRSPGTATDAVAVVARRGPRGYLTAGGATRIGGPVSKAVYKLVSRLGLRVLGPEGLVRNALGYDVDELTDLALEAYKQAEVPGVPTHRARGLIADTLRRVVRDPNVTAFIVAARDLDLRGLAGALPGVSEEEFRTDPRGLVADELLAAALSLYLGGFKGLLATYWVERLKERGGVRISAPVFEDDVVSALIGSVLSLVYDRLLSEGSRE